MTGSRTWAEPAQVRAELDAVLAEHGAVTVVHGACPRGADAHAHAWVLERAAQGHDVDEDPHPAAWAENPRGAGLARNARMVAAGANICLTFIDPCSSPSCRRPALHGSHGAVDCATRAREAGIPVRHVTD